ncbi:MAG TPA: hypothetical protein VLX92_21850 [Kofleriaceae bacterium]|nr:hypothetical protein [Kofleriaceae bacterium]
MRAFRLLVLAIALPACMRGCNPGCSCNGRVEPCTEPSDCPSHETCRRGYCVDEHYAQIDDDCRASAGCAERGECSAIPRSSFLGLDSTLECAATTDRDCRQSKLCRERGQCARNSYDVGCAASEVAACRASERCATHEECELENGQCVRHWNGCPPLAPPGAPAWLAPERLVWDYDSLREPWHPGDDPHATLACQVTGLGTPATTLRVAGRCAPGPRLDRSGTGTFLRADVALRAGDAIAFAADSPASGSPFAQLRYDGNSPAFGGSGGETIECVVVPHAVALERSRRELAAVDRGLVAAGREQPDLSSSRGDLSPSIEDARVHAERAAMWLGWNDSELALRVVRLDAAASAWRARLDAAIRKLVATDKPVHADHMTLTRTGRVCGDALRARLGPAGSSIDATSCALELAIDNAGPDPISLAPGRDSIGEVDELVWLRPAHADQPAEVAPALVLAVQLGTAVTTSGIAELPPGQHGIVLIDGAAPDSLLRGRVGLRDTFVLRP